MTAKSDLTQVLVRAYNGADIMGAKRLFEAKSADPDFLAYAKSELSRMKGIPPERCHVTRQELAFLTDVLAGK